MGQTTHGFPWPEPTDPVAQGQAAIRALAEAVDGGSMRAGLFAGTTDATGYVTVTHGLGFTPRAVFTQSSPAGGSYLATAWLIGTIDVITATTFRARGMTLATASGTNYYVKTPDKLPIRFFWLAFR